MSESLEHLKHFATEAVVKEITALQEKARRYDALYRFVDESDVGYLCAGGVYPNLDIDDMQPPAPAHCTVRADDGGDGIQAAYGEALNSLADFLDANRNAGKSGTLRELSAALLRATGRGADA